MPSSLPYLLYPSLFLDGRAADEVWRDFTENDHTSGDPILNTKSEYDQLIQGIKKLAKDSYSFQDFQKVIFNANYDRRLTPGGYLDNDNNLGVNLYNKYLSQARDDSKGYIQDDQDKRSHRYFIQSVNPKENSFTFEDDLPILYISSPFSIAKAVSNIADKGDRPRYRDGYMISYGEQAGYQSVISGQISGRDNQITTDVYYPLPYAIGQNSITLELSSHDDVITYDNTHSGINLSDGADIALPSAAAFLPSIQFGQNIVNSISNDSTKIESGQFTPPSTSRNPPKPNTQYSFAGSPFKAGEIEYAKNTTTPQESTEELLNGYSNKGTGSESSWGNTQDTWYADRTDISDVKQDESTINIGGQRIFGKSGNDVLHGFDPLLYAGMSASETASSDAANGPLNLKFLNNEKTNIHWTPILLSGGKDQDTFMIGDLSNINLRNGKINSGHKNGSTFYTLLGDKDTLDNVASTARNKESWGEGLSADTYMLTASYDYKEEVIQEAVTLDYSKDGAGIDPFGALQVGRKSAKALLDVSKAAGKNFPGVEAVVSVANLCIEVAKLISKPTNTATVSKFYRDEIRQKVVPPGVWNQTVNIADWDPLDRFVIQTIPIEDPSVKQAEAWSNVNFSIRRENNQSMSPQNFGYTVEMETAIEGKKPIAFLTGLESPNRAAHYGYKTYSFFEGKEISIDPISDITYFGVLANTEGANKIKRSYKESEYDLQIGKDAALFLWNSQGLRDAGLLNQYRSAASSIQIGVDSRKFGWYTDLQLNNSGSGIDLSKSTFNYWDKNSESWKKISLQEFETAAPGSPNDQLATKARFTYWTAQDTEGNKLMNLSAADAANSNDVEFYKTRDDGSVLDPITGKWLAPSDPGYKQAALNEANYAGALSVQQTEDGTTKLIVDEGYKLAPFIETTFADGRVDHIFAFDDVHANDPEHTRDSMVQIDATGVIRFEDMIGGDYDYNDAVLDPTLYPELAALLASSLFN